MYMTPFALRGVFISPGKESEMSKKQKSKTNMTRMLAEAGITIALAVALSFLKFKPVANGGSIDLVMIPLCVFALKWGAGWG